MAKSEKYNKAKAMNFVYGMGAAVVIIGALFKIQHFDLDLGLFKITGGVMLTIGLVVEAIVFGISAFETPEKGLDWAKVYPILGDDDSSESQKKLGEDGMLSQKLDNLLQEAKIDANLMKSLGTSMQNFQTAAEGLSAASASVTSTNRYNEEMSKAALQMESLNSLYKVQVENSSKQAELNTAVVEKTEDLKAQMEALSNNLSSLNGVYGGMLSAMTNK
jgi:gliding motility-associated protein GldL